MPDDDNYSIAEDQLRGVPAIAAFLGISTDKGYLDLAAGRIRAGKEGAIWVASKRALREDYEQLARGLIKLPTQRAGGRAAANPVPPSTPPAPPEPPPRRRVGRPRKIHASSSRTTEHSPLVAKADGSDDGRIKSPAAVTSSRGSSLMSEETRVTGVPTARNRCAPNLMPHWFSVNPKPD
jgi:hypothetical protein